MLLCASMLRHNDRYLWNSLSVRLIVEDGGVVVDITNLDVGHVCHRLDGHKEGICGNSDYIFITESHQVLSTTDISPKLCLKCGQVLPLTCHSVDLFSFHKHSC